MKTIVGIDVGKWFLDVSINGNKVQRYDNTTAGIETLLIKLKSIQDIHVVCEATGGYERLMVQALRSEDISAQVAHPNKVRAFAKACGYLAKNDRLDAMLLSQYGEVFGESQTAQVDTDSRILQGLLRRRQQLIGQRTQEMNRVEKALEDVAKASCERHLVWLNDEIKSLDKLYQSHLQCTESLNKRADLYRSVRGVGVLTAATLLAELPELGQYDGKALTSLVGLAPWSCDSGQRHGYRRIRGGRSNVRQLLYMCALSNIRHDGELQRFYLGLRKRGKAGKVALVAVMRKLLLVLNSIALRGSPWVENYRPVT